MNISKQTIAVGNINADVYFKNVKNIHLNVLPPDGDVRVTAPLYTNIEGVRVFLSTRIYWIKKVQASFNRQERQTAREYVSGESHYLFGKKYRLDVQESNKEIAIKGTNVTKIIMLAPLYATLEQKELAMHSWYKSNLLNFLNSTLEIWDKKLATSDYSWSIRKMKTKWGSCNKQKKKLIFNLELAKKPKKCIDYVVLHELLHLIEPKHNSAFTQLLNKNMPNWVAYKEELNSLVLPKYKTKTRT